jgi:tRNA threonylcarbamoyladenosine modification (KEOPS) complex Cgi121 subunit
VRVEEYDKYVSTLGFRLRYPQAPKELVARAKTDTYPCMVQLFDADSIAGSTHLIYASVNAFKAFRQGRNISQSLDIEILLYVSTQRQISEAIRKVGLQPSTSRIAAVLVAENEQILNEAEFSLEASILGERDDSVLAPEGKRKRLLQLFDITDKEVEALANSKVGDVLPWLIVERSALLDVRR